MQMRAKTIKNILLAASVFAAITAFAQSEKPVVSARVMPDTIMIGDRFTLEIEVDKDVAHMIEFPAFSEEGLGGSIEIAGDSPVDTLERDGRHMKLKKKYTFAAFDEGGYSLGQMPVLYVDKNIVDTLYTTDSLHIWVDTFLINPDEQEIHDIKPPMRAPLKFGEFGGYLLHGLLLIQLILALLYILLKYVQRRGIKETQAPKRTEPAHVVAIRELEKLSQEKLWQNNRHKMYYTRLTDIVREYIEDRYGINAPEMTSDEINSALGELKLKEGAMMQIRRLLSTADYVKFAKYIPEAEDNEMSYHDAYYFIEDTKLMPRTDEDEEDNGEE